MKSYNNLIDEIINSLEKKTSEQLNYLHACRDGHHLSCGDKSKDFYNAAVVLSGKCSKLFIDRLIKVGDELSA